MKTRSQIHKTLFLAFLVAMLLVALQLRFQISPLIQFLEKKRMMADRARLTDSISRDLARLENIATDWGFWNDTYEFAADRNEAYRQTNLQPLWLKQYQLDLLVVSPEEGTAQWIASPDLPFAPEEAAKIAQRGIDQVRSGPLFIQGTPCFFAACPIKGSDGEKPSRGAVLMLQVLNQARIRQMSDRFGAKVTAAASTITPDTSQVRYLGATEMEMSASMPFLNEPRSQLVLSLVEQRRIHPTLMSASHSIAVWFFITVLIFMMLVLIGLERTLIRPLLAIQSGLQDIAGIDVARRVQARQPELSRDHLALVNAYVSEAGALVNEQKQELARQVDYYHQVSHQLTEVVENRDRELANAMQETLAAAETEARRIGENIHDTLCQELIGLSRIVEPMIAGEHPDADPRALLEMVRSKSIELAAMARTYAHDLALHELQDQTLEEALITLARRSRTFFCLEFEMNLDDPLPPLALEIREHIYRILREALYNAHRHAGTRHIWLDILHEDERIIFSMTNDGTPLPERIVPGLGMRQIEMRARLLNATFRIFTGAGGVTVAELIVPVPSNSPAASGDP